MIVIWSVKREITVTIFLPTLATHQMMAVTLHEGIPGHHHQVSLALEDTKVHVIKKLVMVMAFVEGWGLYSEFLGEEMDIYGRNMIQYFGRLEVEMMRAVRLVVDTGIHWKGWSIQESADYMSKYLSLSEQETLVEVKRYAVYPGQALSYKVGELKIKELRKYATDKLGQSKFNIIDFHETVSNVFCLYVWARPNLKFNIHFSLPHHSCSKMETCRWMD